jgi:hypothetical protein
MRQYVDAYSVANTVRMNRSQCKGAVVIVEGSSDVRVYRRFFDEDTCLVLPALGKANATGALKMLDEGGVIGILVIIDSDFWKLDGIESGNPNLLTTDTHDLETMILSSPALEKVLDEFCLHQKRETIGIHVRDMLLDVGRPLGFFRWLSSSRHENLALRFKNLHFEKFIRVENDTVSVHIPRLVREVRLNTVNFMYNERELAEKLRSMIESNHHDPWHVCRGHDLVTILTYLLREVFGNRRARDMDQDMVDALLRLSYEYRYFARTKLYDGIRTWENTHKGYRVLIDG